MKNTYFSPLELVRKYGGPVSHAVLDSNFRLFTHPKVEGLIGYRVVGNYAVVMGNPVCPYHQVTIFTQIFSEYCKSLGLSVIYAVVSNQLRDYSVQLGYASLEVADILFANPQNNPETGPNSHNLRRQVRQARKFGVTVKEYQAASDAHLIGQALHACDAWLNGRQGMQMFLCPPGLFEDSYGQRWLIAEYEGNVVGVLSLLQMGSNECNQLISLVFSAPYAPPHTNELLVSSTLEILRQEGAQSVCLGVAPRAELGEVMGYGRIIEWMARGIYRKIVQSTRQTGKITFWEKFKLTQRVPLYLIFESPYLTPTEVYALIKAFNFSAKSTSSLELPSWVTT